MLTNTERVHFYFYPDSWKSGFIRMRKFRYLICPTALAHKIASLFARVFFVFTSNFLLILFHVPKVKRLNFFNCKHFLQGSYILVVADTLANSLALRSSPKFQYQYEIRQF